MPSTPLCVERGRGRAATRRAGEAPALRGAEIVAEHALDLADRAAEGSRSHFDDGGQRLHQREPAEMRRRVSAGNAGSAVKAATSSGPCTPWRAGSRTSSTRQASGNGRRAMIGAGRVRGPAPAVERQGRPARRSRVPMPERAPRSSASASPATSSAHAVQPARAPPPRQARAACRSRARHAPEWPRRIDDAVTGIGRPRCAASRRDAAAPRALRLRAVGAARRARAELQTPSRGASSASPRLPNRRPETAVQIEKSEMQARARPPLSRDSLMPRASSRDFTAKGGLFGRPRPRIMVRPSRGSGRECGRDREGDQR